jgi:hypothetical protein
MAIISPLVEGVMDEAAAIQVIMAAGHVPGTVYGKNGSGYIRSKVQGFNRSAIYIYYLTLVDLMDTGLPCPSSVITDWVPHREPKMLFRVIVRELESWLLADREGVARFLVLGLSRIPERPEEITDPKRELVNLARRSRNGKVRFALVPEDGSRATVGKLYTSEMIRFINEVWDIQAARNNAPSLDRCLGRLEEISSDE